MADKKTWTPDSDAAAKALIRQTIDAAGESDPSALPHRVKARLKGQATGKVDVEAYVREVMRERSARS